VTDKEIFFRSMEEIEDELFVNMVNDFKSGISHGILVGNLSYELAKRMGYNEEQAYNVKLSGVLHDIGKLSLSQYLYGRNAEAMSIEEVKYMRMHSKIGYEFLKKENFPANVTENVLRHHECCDGSGYPDNLIREEIPFDARIIKVADEFAALISDRPYRKAFDIETAIQIMIDGIKNLDMKVFIQFMRFIHEPYALDLINNSKINLDDLDIRDILNVDEM